MNTIYFFTNSLEEFELVEARVSLVYDYNCSLIEQDGYWGDCVGSIEVDHEDYLGVCNLLTRSFNAYVA